MTDYTVYRIKYATKWQVRVGPNASGKEKAMLFWTSAEPTGKTQNGKPTFAWSSKDYPGKQINFLLGETDISEILLVLDGQKEQVGAAPKNQLYHKNSRGNSTLSFSYSEGERGAGFRFRLSSQVDGKVLAIAHDISLGEAKILGILLRDFISLKFGWANYVPPQLEEALESE